MPENGSNINPDIPVVLNDRYVERGAVAEGKIEIARSPLRELLLAIVGSDASHQPHRVFPLKDCGLKPPRAPANTEHWTMAGVKMQVAGLLAYDRIEKLID